MRVRLLPGERVIVRTRPNPLPLVGPAILGFLLLAIGGFGLGYLTRRDLSEALAGWQPALLLVAGAVVVLLLLRFVVRPLVRWWSNQYILTTLRLIHRRGAIRRTEHRLNLSAIAQLQTDQRLLQRVTGSGTLVVDLGYGRVHLCRDVPRIATFEDYVVQAIADLPLTRMFDGVDMEPGPQFARGGSPRITQRAQQEWRGERP